MKNIASHFTVLVPDIHSLSSVEFCQCCFFNKKLVGADPENSERGDRVPPPPHPRSAPRQMKTSLAAYSIVGVFVMHSKVTLTFRKIELKSIL